MRRFQNSTDPIHPLIMDNHTDALRKLSDCPPRLSEPPDPEDPWPEGYETPGPDPPEEVAEGNKIAAEEAYDTLIQMGGRPTGPIRPTMPWKKVLVDGELCYRYAEHPETLFHSTWHGNRKRDLNTSWTEAEFIAGHWGAECRQFQEELRRWQDFLDTQQWRRDHRLEFAREEDMERQRYPQDPDLTASLKKLKDWKEYQVYFQRGIDRCKKIIEGARRAVEAIQRKDPEVVANKGKIRGRSHRDWLRTIERQREWLAAEEKRSEWVKQQLPAVLSECAASLMGAPTSCRQIEERSSLEARRVYTTLVDTGGRPTRPIRPVPDIWEREHTDEYLHVLCHWEGECSQFEEELREWKKFLDYRQKKETNERTEVQLGEQQSTETTTQVDLWKDYRTYQQLEVDNAKQWVEFWQRQVEYFKQSENICARQGMEDEAYRHHSEAEDARSYVEEAREQVGPPELRLKWVEQQLSTLLAEHAVSTTEVSASNHLEDQAKLPKRISRSSQTTLKELRSDRSSRSTLQGNQQPDKNKKHASANSALGPIHSSKVSKAAGRKAPRPRRQSTIPAEHGDGQSQGPHTMISPSLPVSITPRRSSRLGNNQKKSGALEAGLAADLGRSVQPPPTNIIMRKSDRISKQNERISTSTFTAAVNSAVILQTDPSRRLSRSKPKDRRAGNKSDSSPVKPRGISKRQESSFSRNRTKTHS